MKKEFTLGDLLTFGFLLVGLCCLLLPLCMLDNPELLPELLIAEGIVFLGIGTFAITFNLVRSNHKES